MKFKYVCIDCGKEYVTDDIIYQCPDCALLQKEDEFPRGYLKVIYDNEDLKKLAEKDHVTIYDFFPYPVPTPEVYPVGVTPIVQPRRLNKKLGLKNVICKMDAYLPSGSFKDRASQLIAAQAIAHGEKRIALASTGNAGAAMSCAGAAYGLDIILFVPETAPVNKLMQSVLYGATVVPVKGSYDDAFLLSIEYTKHFGGINRNTAFNPMTIEGKKSVSIELFEQLGRKVPDVVYVPVGDGCIISGVYKGFYDLLHAGLIDKIPHIVCAQSEKSNAIIMAFETGKFKSIEASTRADSISVDIPASGRMAVWYLKEYGGWCTQVTEQEILDAQMSLVHDSGIFVEPASSAAWAALLKDRDMLIKRFGSDVSVCVLLTGIGFKDMAVFDGRVKMPQSIENSKEAVIERFSK
ncbi:MAG: pyridoxal-phosphate dependent enzyme [Spirochaetales bacterium]|nr:pyridoxal-phosphate dependent enzyme [Spirochaetales bacterium]